MGTIGQFNNWTILGYPLGSLVGYPVGHSSPHMKFYIHSTTKTIFPASRDTNEQYAE